jgi:hypothetical protein
MQASLEVPLGFHEQDTKDAVASRDAGEGERCSSVRLNVAGAADRVGSGWVVIRDLRSLLAGKLWCFLITSFEFANWAPLIAQLSYPPVGR